MKTSLDYFEILVAGMLLLIVFFLCFPFKARADWCPNVFNRDIELREILENHHVYYSDSLDILIVHPDPHGSNLNRLAWRVFDTYRKRLVLLASSTAKEPEGDDYFVVYQSRLLAKLSEKMHLQDLMAIVWEDMRVTRKNKKE